MVDETRGGGGLVPDGDALEGTPFAEQMRTRRYNAGLVSSYPLACETLNGRLAYAEQLTQVTGGDCRQRVQEIGIRLALGASIRDVVRLVVMQGMKPAMIGVAIGAAGALALGRLLSSMVYGVKTTDPLTFLAVASLLAFIALLASMIPAYRAAKVDPMVALRYE